MTNQQLIKAKYDSIHTFNLVVKILGYKGKLEPNLTTEKKVKKIDKCKSRWHKIINRNGATMCMTCNRYI